MSAKTSVIFVGEDGWTNTARDLAEQRGTSAHDFHKPWWKGVKLYHRNGYRYDVEKATPDDEVPPVSKLKGAAKHDPAYNVAYEYQSTGFYQLDELKQALRDAVAKGDDSLTKFHKADELIARVDAAMNFDDLVNMLEYAVTQELDI
ncbi:MAG: hypothetical protein K2Y23_26755 [Cyanobacteria bacterium]|nr:hypothetical protein [Cyanobacteriota bacterium]